MPRRLPEDFPPLAGVSGRCLDSQRWLIRDISQGAPHSQFRHFLPRERLPRIRRRRIFARVKIQLKRLSQVTARNGNNPWPVDRSLGTIRLPLPKRILICETLAVSLKINGSPGCVSRLPVFDRHFDAGIFRSLHQRDSKENKTGGPEIHSAPSANRSGDRRNQASLAIIQSQGSHSELATFQPAIHLPTALPAFSSRQTDTSAFIGSPLLITWFISALRSLLVPFASRA